jgi:hypothetical protein
MALSLFFAYISMKMCFTKILSMTFFILINVLERKNVKTSKMWSFFVHYIYILKFYNIKFHFYFPHNHDWLKKFYNS